MTNEGNVQVVETIASNKSATCPTCEAVSTIGEPYACTHLIGVSTKNDNGTEKLVWHFYK